MRKNSALDRNLVRLARGPYVGALLAACAVFLACGGGGSEAADEPARSAPEPAGLQLSRLEPEAPGQAAAQAPDAVSETAVSETMDARSREQLAPFGASNCGGSCEQKCDCIERACADSDSGELCRQAVTDCRVGCGVDRCSQDDPQCSRLGMLPDNRQPDPDDPEPAPGGPGPDPLPIDASGSQTSDTQASGSAESGSSSSGSPASGSSDRPSGAY